MPHRIWILEGVLLHSFYLCSLEGRTSLQYFLCPSLQTWVSQGVTLGWPAGLGFVARMQRLESVAPHADSLKAASRQLSPPAPSAERDSGCRDYQMCPGAFFMSQSARLGVFPSLGDPGFPAVNALYRAALLPTGSTEVGLLGACVCFVSIRTFCTH